jgi:hypothetical protein
VKTRAVGNAAEHQIIPESMPL